MLLLLGVDHSFVLLMGALVAVLWFSAAAVSLSLIFVRWLLPIYWSDLKSVLYRLRDHHNAAWRDALENYAKKT
jgi:hypothetical protein